MERAIASRSLFSIPDGVAYLNHAYMAPQLRAMTAEGNRAIARKEEPWTIAADDFFEPVEQLRRAAATIFDCSHDFIALVPSVSYGVATAARVLPQKTEGKILVLAEQFPSNVYPWVERAKETGENVVFVEKGEHCWTEALLQHIDTHTSVIAIPGCHWTDGSRVDLKIISEAAKSVGSALVLDLTQSLGAVPFSTRDIDPDFVLAAGYKWLMGPYSLGYMYVAERHHKGAPFENNWITRRDSHQFASLVDYGDHYEAGARRYDVGERSNFFLVPMALLGLQHINQWGVENMCKSISEHVNAIIEHAEKRGWSAPPHRERSPHMVGIRREGGLPDGLVQTLVADKIYVSVRGDSIRISPHLYTTNQDIERLFHALERLS